MEEILETINKIGIKFLAPLTSVETYRLTVRTAADLLNADWAFLYLEKNGDLELVAKHPAVGNEIYTPRRNGFTYRAFSQRRAFVIKATGVVKVHPELGKKDFGTAICIPLSDHQKSFGALTLFTYDEREFTRRELTLLKLLGSYASVGIRKAALFEGMQEALVIRDHFISLAAHELRTPLTSINGYIQLLHSKLAKSDTSEARWIQSLLKESKRLTKLVSELLVINRLKAGQLKYSFKNTDLKELVEASLQRFRKTHPGRRIVFDNRLRRKESEIVCDPEKLFQIFNNLFDNAAKFSPTSSTITLRLSLQNPHYLIQIEDKGSGLTEKDLARVFEGFYKGGENLKSGLALGLLFAKHVLAFHQGTISLRSTVGMGTTVEVRLPHKPKRFRSTP